MVEKTSLRLLRAERPAAARDTFVLTREETRRIFKGMVVAELDAGFLRYSRRQALLKQASRMGIADFEAALLIAEAQYYSGDLEPIEPPSALLQDESQTPAWSASTQLAFAAVVALLLDLALIRWLF